MAALWKFSPEVGTVGLPGSSNRISGGIKLDFGNCYEIVYCIAFLRFCFKYSGIL